MLCILAILDCAATCPFLTSAALRSLQSKTSAGGRFRLELWFKSGNESECAAVAKRISDVLSANTPAFGLSFAPHTEVSASAKVDALHANVDISVLVAEKLGGEVRHVRREPSGFNEAVYVVRVVGGTGGAAGVEREVVLRVAAVDAGSIAVETAVIDRLAATGIPVPTILASGSAPVPFVIYTRAPGEPLSLLWPTLSFDERKTVFTQLLAFGDELSKITFPAIGTLDAALAFKPDEFAARSVAVASAGGEATDANPVTGYYQRCFDEKYRTLQNDVRQGDLTTLNLSKLTAFFERDAPTLCAGYTGKFSVVFSSLRLRDVLIDRLTAKVTLVSGWGKVRVLPSEDNVAAVMALADTQEELSFIATASTTAAASTGFAGRQNVRRLLTLCDRIIEHRVWSSAKATRQEEMLKAASGELKAKFSSVGGGK